MHPTTTTMPPPPPPPNQKTYAENESNETPPPPTVVGGSSSAEVNKRKDVAKEKEEATTVTVVVEAAGGSGREKLKRHRVDVAGRVWVPDMWGQEDFLKDWADCASFDASLVNSSIVSARDSLMAEGRRAAASSRLRIQNMVVN